MWFAWGIKDSVSVARMHQLAGSRAEIRAQAVHIALQGVLELLGKKTETA